MANFPIIRFPEASGSELGGITDRPVGLLRADYDITTPAVPLPPGHSLAILKTNIALVNGVDVFKYLGGVNRTAVVPDRTTLAKTLWSGDYVCSIQQTIQYNDGVTNSLFPTGVIWEGQAKWTKELPIKDAPYRMHVDAFAPGRPHMLASMDRIWREHQDHVAVEQLIGSLADTAIHETIDYVNARNTSYVKLVEPVDRTRIAVVNLEGAIGERVPYSDIQTLYSVGENSRAFLYGKDFFIANDGTPVFVAKDTPGRVRSGYAAIPPGALFATRPAAFTSPGSVILQRDSVALFAETRDVITGFDFFISPPQVVKDGGYPTAPNGSDHVGTIFAVIPGTNERIVLYDPTISSESYSGQIKLKKPLSLAKDQYITIYQVRPTAWGPTQTIMDVNPPITVQVWLNRKVTLLGANAHVKSSRLNKLWTPIVGGEAGSDSLADKLRVAAGMKARTEKSIAAFTEYVAALLELPLSPFDNAVVVSVTKPDPAGFIDGQINIYGAILEYDLDVDLAVQPGDVVSFLQPLLRDVDGITIDDLQTDPDFLSVDQSGAMPAGQNPNDLDYVKSKIVGAVTMPPEISSQFPITTSPLFFAAKLLRGTSFRINLGVYASERLLKDTTSIDRIFAAIDAVKPSGTDYWLRLSDGTVIVRGSTSEVIIDVSSRLTFPTDYANRIFSDADFAPGQYRARYITVDDGSIPRAGDVYRMAVSDLANFPVITNYDVTLTQADIQSNPLHPMDVVFAAWAASLNIDYAPDKIIATVSDHALRLFSGQLELIRYTRNVKVGASQLAGFGTVTFTPSAGNLQLVAPDDISSAFKSQTDAVAIMDAYAELAAHDLITPANDVLIEDNSAGPFDTTVVVIPNAGLTLSTDAIVDAFESARVALKGWMSLSIPDGEMSVFLGYTFATPGDFTTGSVLQLRVTHPTLFPLGQTVTRTMTASDATIGAVFAGLAKKVYDDGVIPQYYLPRYPAAAPGDYYLELRPVDFSRSDLDLFTFELSAFTGVPASTIGLRIKNALSGTPVTGNPVSVFGRKAKVVTLTGTFAPAAYSIRPSAHVMRYADVGGGHDYHVFNFIGEQATIPPASVAACALVPTYLPLLADPTTQEPTINLATATFFVNDYPEYSRDDDSIFYDDCDPVIEVRAEDFTVGSCVVPPVRDPVVFYENFISDANVTSSLVGPSNQITSTQTIDYGETEVHSSGIGVGVHFLVQTKCAGPTDVNITYLPGSTRLYALTGTDTYVPLALTTNYTEAGGAQPNQITIVSLPVGTTAVIGFVKSTMWAYYYEGPNASSRVYESSVLSGYGVSGLYEGSGNEFRLANIKIYDPTTAAAIAYDTSTLITRAATAPTALPLATSDAYRASKLPKKKEFAMDDDKVLLQDLTEIT